MCRASARDSERHRTAGLSRVILQSTAESACYMRDEIGCIQEVMGTDLALLGLVQLLSRHRQLPLALLLLGEEVILSASVATT
jgi:hypothetical protein